MSLCRFPAAECNIGFASQSNQTIDTCFYVCIVESTQSDANAVSFQN
jgi:hypothetical protein